MKKIIVYGVLGQAVVILPIIQKQFDIIAFVDEVNENSKSLMHDVPICHSFEECMQLLKNNKISISEVYFALAIGGTYGYAKVEIHKKLMLAGLHPANLVHNRSWVAESAIVGSGIQVLAMAAVGERVVLGDQVIINTNASVDHETILGNGVHVMPGATITGCCKIGDFTSIGSNATVLPRVTIGSHVIVGAGAVVTKHIPDACLVTGVPAKIVKMLEGEIISNARS